TTGKSPVSAPVIASAAEIQSDSTKISDAVPAAATSGAVVTGKVFFRGIAPPEKTIDMSSDAACKALHDIPVTTRHYVVGTNGSLANVLVYVRDGLGTRRFPPPMKPVVLDQRGCLYQPYVLGVQVGQPL